MLTPRFNEALSFAADLHRDQRRKGSGVPYVTHLLSVCALVLEHGGDEDEAIGALLHDAIEDQGHHFSGGVGALREAIASRFGPRALEIVEGCTDSDEHPKPPWKERKQRYIEHVKEAPEAVRRVSCADKLHNARSVLSDYRTLGDAVWDRFKGGRHGTLWYYRTLADLFVKLGPHPLAEELDRTVSDLERAAHRRG